MRGYYDYLSDNQSETDYRAHISKLARAQSILTDVPHYEDTHKMFSNTRASYEEDNHDQPKYRTTTHFDDKVKVTEYKEAIDSPDNVNARVSEETVNVEIDNSRQRRMGFGLWKWKTFKGK